MILLEGKGLRRLFGGLAALDGVDLGFEHSQILGIIGPNGAGKTTLINIISGIYPPTEGRILFEGRDITSIPSHKRCRMGITRTFQLVRPLEGLDLLENVMVGGLFGRGLGLRSARREAKRVCTEVGLMDLHRPVSQLSALEVKKMELARALICRPKLLLLDEIMAGLNRQETEEMMEIIRRIQGWGLTIGIIEHVMQVIKELAHRVIVLDWGRVIAEGNYEEVASDPQVIAAYLGEGD